MVNYERAADQIIALYGDRLGLEKPPPLIVCFDPNGTEVPFEQVQDGSPGGMAGELEYFDPTPGHGFYAFLFLEGEGFSRNGDNSRKYVIKGPDWEIVVYSEANTFSGHSAVERKVNSMSEGGERFLAPFAAFGL